MSIIDCFQIHGFLDLKSVRDKKMAEGMSEALATREAILEYQKGLSDELNTLRKSIDPIGKKLKQEPFETPDITDKIETVKAEYKEKIKTQEDAIQKRETEEVPVGEQAEPRPKVDEEIRVEAPPKEVKEEVTPRAIPAKVTQDVSKITQKVKTFDEGVRVGEKQQKKFVNAIRDEVAAFIKENEKDLRETRGRVVTALMRKVNNATTLAQLKNAIVYMERVVDDVQFAKEESVKESIRQDIVKTLQDKNYLKKESGRLKAKGIGYEAYKIVRDLQKVFDRDGSLWDMEQEAEGVIERIMETREKEGRGHYTDEEALAIDLLKLATVDQGITSEGMREIKNALDAFIKNEKSKFRQRQEQIREANKQIREEGALILSENSKFRAFSESDVRREIQKIQRQVEKEGRELNPSEQERIKHLEDNMRIEESYAPNKLKKVMQEFGSVGNAHWWGILDMLSQNQQSMGAIFQTRLHEMFGDPIIESENKYWRLLKDNTKLIQDAMEDIFGFESKTDRVKYMEHMRELRPVEYTEKGKKHTMKISQGEAYYLYQKFQDPTLTETVDRYFSPEKKEAIEKFLEPSVKEWADYQLKTLYPKLYEVFNPFYVEYFGRDMPFNEFYSPLFREINAKDTVWDAFEKKGLIATVNDRATKQRVGSQLPIKWMDGDIVLANYLDKMSHWAGWYPTINKLNTFFKNRNTTDLIKRNFGDFYNTVIDDFINDFARMVKGIHRNVGALDNLRTRIYPATLGLKPVIAVKQLTSIPAFASYMPVGDFMVGLGKFFTNPLKYKNMLMQESEYLQARYNKGWDRDLLLDMKKSYDKMMTNKENLFRDSCMFLVKWGDRAAILSGGYAVYNHTYNQNKHLGHDQAHKMAIRQFEYATRLSQQASGTADLSYWQRHSTFAKFFTMYLNAPSLYHRTTLAGVRRLMKGENPAEAAKVVFINHILLPSLFTFVGNGFKWHEKDQLQAAVLGNIQMYFLAGKLGVGAFEWIIGNRKTPAPGVDLDSYSSHIIDAGLAVAEFNKLMNKWQRGVHDISIWEVMAVMDKLGKATAPMAGTPYPAISNLGHAIYETASGKTDDPALRLTGWSDWSLQRGDPVSVLWDKHQKALLDVPENVREYYGELFGDVNEYLFIRENQKIAEDEDYRKIQRIERRAERQERDLTPEEQLEIEKIQEKMQIWSSGEMSREAKNWAAWHEYDISDKITRQDLKIFLGTRSNEYKAEHMRERFIHDFKRDQIRFELEFLDKYSVLLGSYINEKGNEVDISPVITNQLLEKYREMY